jgi:hypothetical protein
MGFGGFCGAFAVAQRQSECGAKLPYARHQPMPIGGVTKRALVVNKTVDSFFYVVFNISHFGYNI